MARKFTHQIAARNPHRQFYDLLRRRVWNGERDLKQMTMHIEHLHAVVHTRRCARCASCNSRLRHQVAPVPSKHANVARRVSRKRRVSQSPRPAGGQVLRSTR